MTRPTKYNRTAHRTAILSDHGDHSWRDNGTQRNLDSSLPSLDSLLAQSHYLPSHPIPFHRPSFASHSIVQALHPIPSSKLSKPSKPFHHSLLSQSLFDFAKQEETRAGPYHRLTGMHSSGDLTKGYFSLRSRHYTARFISLPSAATIPLPR
jgi:hypothetical protein